MKAGNHKLDQHARAAFKADLARWAERINVKPKRVQVQHMTTKWASCSPSGRLCFAADLLNQTTAFRDAVIVHELLHLIVPNHGKLFKSMLRAYLPEALAKGQAPLAISSGRIGCRRSARREK